MIVGTVAYMSPEQTLGKPLDFRSDQFSFGSMLYEMVTGRKAFARATGPETMTAIIRDEPESLAVGDAVEPRAAALDHRAVPGQGGRGAVRLDPRPRERPGAIERGDLRSRACRERPRPRRRGAARLRSRWGSPRRHSRSSSAPRSASSRREGAGSRRRLPRRHLSPRDDGPGALRAGRADDRLRRRSGRAIRRSSSRPGRTARRRRRCRSRARSSPRFPPRGSSPWRSTATMR